MEKWKKGMPTEDGVYIVTIKDDNVLFVDTDYYSVFGGWECYNTDNKKKVIAWINVSTITPHDCDNKGKKFKWVAKSDDGAFEDESTRCFATQKECYDDMRNHALEKMKWNTEYGEDFEDGKIGYSVLFDKNEIVHSSYSGVYIYKIVPLKKKFEITLPFQGSIIFDIEADSEEDAISIAMSDEVIKNDDILQNLIYGSCEVKEID